MALLKSIKQKLLFIIVTISFVVVLTGMAVLFYSEILSEKQAQQEEADLLVAMIADYISGPLMFEDRTGGEEVLERLKYVPDLLRAEVFTVENKIFISYGAKNNSMGNQNNLIVKKSIEFKETALGFVELTFSDEPIRDAIASFLKMTIILLAGTVVISAILALVLQKPVSQPILHLVTVMQKVSQSRDFSLRVSKRSDDEVGKLYDEFNYMISNIQERDKKLKRARSFLKDLINSMPSVLFSVDKEGIITNVNKSALLDLGKSEHELIGEQIIPFYPEFKEILEEIPGVASTLIPLFVNEKLHVAADGSEHYFSVSISPLLEGEGAVVQFYNISKEVELKQQLLQNRKLEAIGQLAGGIAHDFNNQLSGIMGFAQVIDENTDKEMLKSSIDGIITAAERAASLTTKLLSFSRKHRYDAEVFEVNKVVLESITVLERSLQKKVKIEYSLSETTLFVEGDSSQIANAFLNLGINARDAMPSGGVLSFSTEKVMVPENDRDLEPGEYICVTISDTGTGMSKEIQEKVFEPFFTTKELGKGTGLGLAAVYGTVRQHNGAIKLESTVGVGTTFRLYLPLSAKEVSEDSTAAVESSKSRDGIKVAVLDDEDSVRISTKLVLQKCGFEVIEFNSGYDAINFFKENPDNGVDILVSDNMMPDLNGIESYREIKKYSPNLKAIIASGFCSPDDEKAYLQEGVSAIIDKPCSAQVLVSEIQNALS